MHEQYVCFFDEILILFILILLNFRYHKDK
jgi:hypothetical protein